MAAPNIIGATTIYGKTTGTSLTTGTITVLNNASNSGKCLKVNTLNVANYGSTTTYVTVGWYDAANISGTSYNIVGNVAVPGNSTLNIIDKTSQYYLEENQSLGASAGTADSLVVTCSYEDIS